jgi:regulator of sigma D
MQPIRPIDMELIRALARGDKDYCQDLIKLGANGNLKIANSLMNRLRDLEAQLAAEAKIYANLIIEKARASSKLGA